ncbi:MAG: branched-chain amino acid ABC transporter permease [Acidiferrobacterales bacterium]|nr:branched-chain amino acid ABC transporter permease [Gammaproteobacteria bacterium]
MSGTRDLLASLLPAVVGAVVVTVYLLLVLSVESQAGITVLLVAGAITIMALVRFGGTARFGRSFAEQENTLNLLIILAVLVITGFFYEDHFVLLLVATVIIYVIACLGLNVQFGYTGVLNFAGAAFFGIGCYTAAVLTMHTPIPHVLILVIGGLMAAVIGSILILPVLRTRSHYSAVVTIAFALLFKIFLEVNDTLGGPQGLRVQGMNLLGWEFNNNIEIGENLEVSFYVNYILIGLLLLAVTFTFVKRLERSWVGLNLDAVRLDETAAACFGLNIARWKVTAFTIGNFLVGMAGALYAMMIGFIAPTNFTFGDSLILVSIVLLGGIGNPWGLVVATTILIVLPEKLQAIQEYRFLLFAAMVILILLFRPEGLLPRPLRTYLPGWRPK